MLNYNDRTNSINSGLEIEINTVELTECNGNLRRLQQEYGQNTFTRCCPAIKKKSKSKMADVALVEVPATVAELATALSEFMEASCNFFEKMGLEFEKTDEDISSALKK